MMGRKKNIDIQLLFGVIIIVLFLAFLFIYIKNKGNQNISENVCIQKKHLLYNYSMIGIFKPEVIAILENGSWKPEEYPLAFASFPYDLPKCCTGKCKLNFSVKCFGGMKYEAIYPCIREIGFIINHSLNDYGKSSSNFSDFCLVDFIY